MYYCGRHIDPILFLCTLPCLPIILSCLTDSHTSLYLNSLLNSANSLCPLSHHLPLAPPSITPCHSERSSTFRKILSRSIYSTTTLIPLIVKAPAVLRCLVLCQRHLLIQLLSMHIIILTTQCLLRVCLVLK